MSFQRHNNKGNPAMYTQMRNNSANFNQQPFQQPYNQPQQYQNYNNNYNNQPPQQQYQNYNNNYDQQYNQQQYNQPAPPPNYNNQQPYYNNQQDDFYQDDQQYNQNNNNQTTRNFLLRNRAKGYFSAHDAAILSNAQIITWRGTRIIGMVFGGVYFFGKDAINLLERQVAYMSPSEMGKDTSKDPNGGFSFGIHARSHSSSLSISGETVNKFGYMIQRHQKMTMNDVTIQSNDNEIAFDEDTANRYVLFFIYANIFSSIREIDRNEPGLVRSNMINIPNFDFINLDRLACIFYINPLHRNFRYVRQMSDDQIKNIHSYQSDQLTEYSRECFDEAIQIGRAFIDEFLEFKELFDNHLFCATVSDNSNEPLDVNLEIRNFLSTLVQQRCIVTVPWHPTYRDVYVSWSAVNHRFHYPTRDDPNALIPEPPEPIIEGYQYNNCNDCRRFVEEDTIGVQNPPQNQNNQQPQQDNF